LDLSRFYANNEIIIDKKINPIKPDPCLRRETEEKGIRNSVSNNNKSTTKSPLN
jgi:hypothetical protein